MKEDDIQKALNWLQDTMGVCTSNEEYINGEIVLGMINSLKAEISVKDKLLAKAESRIEAAEMDINQLKSDIACSEMNYGHIKQLWESEKEKVEKAKIKMMKVCKKLKTAKVEGAKEFAERFEEEMGESFFNHYPFVLTALDNLVRDMEEQSNV